MKADKYLQILTKHIENSKIRRDIMREYQDHIEDCKEALMESGMREAEAEDEAVRQMGDPDEAGSAIYTYCYMARIENTFKNTIKDSFLIMFLCPAQNLKIVILLVLGGLAVYLFLPAVFFVPSLTCFLIHKGMEKTLGKYMILPEEERCDGDAR